MKNVKRMVFTAAVLVVFSGIALVSGCAHDSGGSGYGAGGSTTTARDWSNAVGSGRGGQPVGY